MASLHPTEGVRLVIERVASAEGAARYRVDVYEPDGVRSTGAASLGSTVELRFSEGTPPAWAEAFLMRFLKGLAKKHAEDGAWPRKLTRWRAPER